MTPDRRVRFEQLAGQVWTPLQRYLQRRTDADSAQDVLAETLLVLWRRLDDVPTEEPLPWAYGVARHCLANSRRSAARQDRLLARLAAEPVEPSGPTGGGPGEDGSLELALARLRAPDRELLQLWAWEKLEAREIAQVLGTSVPVVSVRLHRARSRLRKVLGELDGKMPGGAGQEQVEGTRRTTGD